MILKEYWYPWFPASFQEKTMHLSVLEDGMYRRLIDHYMLTKKPLPNDSCALARICGMPKADFEHASSRVKAMFEEKDDKLVNRKCEKELAEQQAQSEIRRNRASKGGLAKSNKANDNNGNPASSMPKASSKRAQAVLKRATITKTEHNNNRAPEDYYFSKSCIQIDKPDWERWLEMFPNITDNGLEKLLLERGDWYSNNPEQQTNWFMRTQKYLEGINNRGG